MIANVSPSASTFEDTYNTLKYANRAKNIKTHISRNVLSVQYHISNYKDIINNLKSEIVDLKAKLAHHNVNTIAGSIDQVSVSNKNYEINIIKKEEYKEAGSKKYN